MLNSAIYVNVNSQLNVDLYSCKYKCIAKYGNMEPHQTGKCFLYSYNIFFTAG